MDCDRIVSLGWRGIIATTSAILLFIPAACHVHSTRSNSLRDARGAALLGQRQSELEGLRSQLFRCEEEIRNKTSELDASHGRLDAIAKKHAARTTELAEKLRILQTIEEDLAAAKKKQDAAKSELASLAKRQKQVAERDKVLADLNKRLPQIDKAIEAREAELKTKVATLQGIEARLKSLVELQAKIAAAVKAVEGAPPVPAKDPPKK